MRKEVLFTTNNLNSFQDPVMEKMAIDISSDILAPSYSSERVKKQSYNNIQICKQLFSNVCHKELENVEVVYKLLEINLKRGVCGYENISPFIFFETNISFIIKMFKRNFVFC